MDRRLAAVLGRINPDLAAPAGAEEYAALANLSFSRFLHLFKQGVGAPFRSLRTCKRARSLRTCKRARSLLPYVNQAGNLAHVALDAGHSDPAGGWAEAERQLCRLAAPRGA